MGCNCKKTHDTYRKLSDDPSDRYDDEKTSAFDHIFNVIAQFIFGTVVGAILLVCIVPMLIYIIGCLMLGKEPSFRIVNIKKHFNKND